MIDFFMQYPSVKTLLIKILAISLYKLRLLVGFHIQMDSLMKVNKLLKKVDTKVLNLYNIDIIKLGTM